MNDQDGFQEKTKANVSVASGDNKITTDAEEVLKSGPIRAKIEAFSEKVRREGAEGKSGKALRKKAVALILKSADSSEWQEYMNLFGFNESELKKLIPDKKDTKKNVSLAYLVGNSPCGAASTDSPTYSLLYGVTDTLDKS